MNDERVPLFYVGHSFGGHALGLLPNHDRIARAYLFAVGAGWHGWMPPLERVRVQVLWNVVLPVLTSCYGYMPSRMLGMGDPQRHLPLPRARPAGDRTTAATFYTVEAATPRRSSGWRARVQHRPDQGAPRQPR
jgi:hypothetical protein